MVYDRRAWPQAGSSGVEMRFHFSFFPAVPGIEPKASHVLRALP